MCCAEIIFHAKEERGLRMQLPETVTTVKHGDTEIYLLGTAHVSKQSVTDVTTCVEEIQPTSICIELCESRYKSIRDRDSWKKMDIFQVFKEKKVLFLIAQLILSSFYRKLGKQLEVTPGAEMIQGADEAEARDIDLVLADRNIEITLRRVWGGLSLFQKAKFILTMIPSFLFNAEEIDDATVEELKEQDNLEAAMDEMGKGFPGIRERLIHERDIYLSEMIKSAKGDKVLAVVGAGHVPGIVERLKEEHDLATITEIPRPSIWPKLITYIVPLTVILVFTIVTIFKGFDDAVSDIKVWIIANMILGALGAMVALAHPVTTLVTAVVSPISSLIPTIPAGIIAGLVEAHFKKPTVEDLEGVPEATETIKGWWSNGFTHLLVIFFLASMGSALGAWFSIFFLGKTILTTIVEYWPIFVGAITLLAITLHLTTSRKSTYA